MCKFRAPRVLPLNLFVIKTSKDSTIWPPDRVTIQLPPRQAPLDPTPNRKVACLMFAHCISTKPDEGSRCQEACHALSKLPT